MRLKGVKPDYEAAPKGRYRVKITAAETQVSSKGAPMIKATFEIRDGGHEGKVFYDYFLTDASYRGAFQSAQRLQSLGVDVNADVDDAVICDQILGREVYADLDVEDALNKDKSKKVYTDPSTGAVVQMKNNRATAYYAHAIAPSGAQHQPQMQAPVAAPSYTPPQAPAMPPAMPAGFPSQPGFPGGFPGAAQQAAPPPAPPVQQQPVQQQPVAPPMPGFPGAFPGAQQPQYAQPPFQQPMVPPPGGPKA